MSWADACGGDGDDGARIKLRLRDDLHCELRTERTASEHHRILHSYTLLLSEILKNNKIESNTRKKNIVIGYDSKEGNKAGIIEFRKVRSKMVKSEFC